MRILAFSDIHADEDALDSLRTYAIRSDIDYVICAGDLSNRGPVSFVNELISLFSEKFYFVHGNMDSQNVVDSIRQSPGYIHGRKAKLGEWNLVGLGGSNPTPFNTPSEMSERQIEHILNTSNIDQNTILVSHPPPYGVFDEVSGGIHAGSHSVKKILDEKKPLILICGHIHEHEGQKIVGETLVIKLPAAESRRAAFIDITDEIKVEFFSF